MSKKQVNLWLPAEDVAALDRLATAQQRSRSNLVRLLIGEYVRSHEAATVEAGTGNEATDAGVRTGDRV